MRFLNFIRDRWGSISITAGAWLVMLVFFFAFHMTAEQGLIISVVYVLAAVGRLLYEYGRKYGFYRGLAENSAQLDQKYLLSEMLVEPDFYEGKLFYEVLCGANKSMCEQVARYRREAAQFREYIEMWVHEVKLPVASLLLMCHNRGKMNEKYALQLRRIDDYIENVLYYARSENAEKDYLIKEVSLKRVFADVMVRNREELQQKGVAIRTEHLDKQVMTDGKWLGFIFGQLLGNTMKYFSRERGSELSVWASEDEQKVILHFRDNGVGISESDLPYVFEKSFTGENGRTHAKSTGMGLYIVKNLCDRLGHGIEVWSVKGEYTEVVITFAKNDYYLP